MALPRGEGNTFQTYHEVDINELHQGSHWMGGVQAMCDAILRIYVCLGIYTVAK
jgi:hypothetical protein